jgi:hypothetical protein
LNIPHTPNLAPRPVSRWGLSLSVNSRARTSQLPPSGP